MRPPADPCNKVLLSPKKVSLPPAVIAPSMPVSVSVSVPRLAVSLSAAVSPRRSTVTAVVLSP